MISSELYDSKPDDYGGITLTLRRPIRTRDARTVGPSMPLMRDGQAVRLSTRQQRGHTRDDVLTGPEPVTRISLGKVWAGDDGDPLVAMANYATSALAEGCFAAGRVLHAESLETVISLGRVWLSQLEAVKSKLETADALAHKGTKDGTPPRSTLFGSGKPTPATQYAEALRNGRATRDGAAPKPVRAALDYAGYAATLTAGRAAKAKDGGRGQ